MDRFAPYAKALVAMVVAGATAAIPLVDDGLTASEILGILVAALGTGGATYVVPNRARTVAPVGRHRLDQMGDDRFDIEG